ncbi:tol-pal system protein YbgF [Thiomicrorhabdus sediminis]|nr:tol-pal system protein YbgF [Thiomicrorhabdus sediminis]
MIRAFSNFKQKALVSSLAALLMMPLAPSHAAQGASLDERVQRLERMMENPVLLQLSRRLGDQQREIQQLQDANDRLKRQMQLLQKKLDARYSETDQRLSVLEGNGSTDAQLAPAASNAAPAMPAITAPAAPNAEAPAATDSNPAAAPASTSLEQTQAAKTEPETPQPNQQAALVEQPAETATPAEHVMQPIQTHKPTDAEQLAYKNAFSLMRASKYDESIKAFEAFLTQYPKSQLASNAAYWSGEGYLIKGDNESALKAFQIVINSYPQSPKVPDAKLRAGDCFANLNQPGKAKVMYEEVISSRPSSRAAETAKKRLEK